MIGRTISHYKILEKLGGGGMGVVYKAQDLKLDRIVALKFLPPELIRDPESKHRFIHEAKSASALQHNNICTVHDIDETTDGQMFIALDYYEGETLKSRIAKGQLLIEDAIDIAIQIGQGLEEAHGHQIVHRDIKPANILISKGGVVKIVDFGLAKLVGQTMLTKSGSTVGTAAYMSPEQARGEQVDARTDIWSLGVVIYEMVTGQRPFKGEYDNAVLYSILNSQPEAMTSERKDVPIELEHIVNTAIAKDRIERYQSIAEMLADLRKLLKLTEMGRVPGVEAPGVHARKKSLRLKTAAVLGILALVLIVIFDPLGFRSGVTESESPLSKTLAVMYFENLRDPEDKEHVGEILTRLMITSLTETKGLEVISRERLYEIQKELGQVGSTKIEASTASKIAQRAGASIMLTGTIVETQPQLTVSTQLVDVKSGKIVASQQVSPHRPDQLFVLVDSLSTKVRSELVGSIREAKTVASITTSSPEAYRAYVEGDELRKRLLGVDARTVLRRATEIDPRFAMAYWALRYTNNYLGNREEAKEDIVKAWGLRGNVTEPERLLIEAGYYTDIEGDNAKAARVLEELVEKFPHYQGAYTELVATYYYRCQFPEAERIISIGLKYDSLDKRLLNQIAYLSAGRNDIQKALNAVNQEVAISPGDPNTYDSKGDIYCLVGSPDSASYWFNKANSFRSNFSARSLARLAVIRQEYVSAAEHFKDQAMWGPTDKAESECASAVILMNQGRLKMAEKELLKISRARRGQGVATAGSIESSYLTFVSYELRKYDAMVDIAGIRSDELKQRSSGPIYGRDVLAWASMKSGNVGFSSSLINDIGHDIAGKSPRLQMVLDYANALQSFETGDFQNSLQQFRQAFQPLFQNRAPEYFYGLVLLRTGNTSEAIRELERVTRWFPLLWNVVNIFPTNMYWPIASVKAHYWLGVACENQGDLGRSVKEYQQFLGIWKNADFDSPEIRDAKVRLQKLNKTAGK